MKRVIFIVVIILLLGVFAFSAWQVVDTLLEYRAGEKFYEDMGMFISIPEETQPWDKEEVPETTDAAVLPEETVPEEPEPVLWPEVDFQSLQQINDDVVGWIYIPGTQVNYPIMQGKDNDQYLYHLLTGEYNSSGSIFLEADVEGDFSAKNSPIYGHNMKNGSMFADITSYKDQSFYDAHPVGMLLTPEGNFYVHLFSAYVTSVWSDSWDTSFSENDFASWLKAVERKSYFASDVIPTTQDHVLTFSTCTYESDDVRFVVHGVLEKYIPE